MTDKRKKDDKEESCGEKETTKRTKAVDKAKKTMTPFKETNDFSIVGLGASASGMGFVIIQLLNPTYKRIMTRITRS